MNTAAPLLLAAHLPSRALVRELLAGEARRGKRRKVTGEAQ